MCSLQNLIYETIEGYKVDLNNLSQELWNNPELAYNEFRAHEVLCNFLRLAGFNVTPSYKLDTAFRAEFGSDSGPNIAVLCEYDALPGVGHACGHNLIAEVGIATGLALKAVLEFAAKENIFKGKVTVLGTPAEEGGGGKIQLIEAGAFDDIDVALMAHPTDTNISAPTFLALNTLRVEFHGRATHGVKPWDGLNALDAAVIAYQSICCLRLQSKPSYNINTIISKGGEKANIIPALAELQLYIRCLTKAEADVLMDKVKKCCNAAALATGCSVNFNQDVETSYSEICHNPTLVRLFEEHAKEVGLDYSAKETEITGSTDMGNVTHVVPGIHPHFSIGPATCHTTEFCTLAGSKEAQIPTIKEAQALALTALDVFADPNIFEEVKETFRQQIFVNDCQ